MTGENKSSLRESLSRIDFLAGAPDRVLQELEKKLVRITFDKSSYILRSGRTGSAFYILTSGTVSIWTEDEQGQEIRVTTLSPPSHFGEIAPLEETTRIASVIAEEPVTAYLFKKEDLEALTESYPQIYKQLKKVAAARKIETEKVVEKSLKGKALPSQQHNQSSINIWEKSVRDSKNLIEPVKTQFLPLHNIPGKTSDSKNPSAAARTKFLPLVEAKVKKPESEQSTRSRQKAAMAAYTPKGRVWKLSQHSLCLFTLQFSTMFNAGLSYVAALQSLTQTSDANLNRVAEKLSVLIKSGFPLWKAMENIPEAFSPFYINVVRQNEQIGNLPGGMQSIADYLDKEEKKRSKLIASLTYPFMIVVSSCVMVAFLMFYVFPRFIPLFENEGAEIPWVTQVILTFTKCPTLYFFIFSGIVLVISFFLIYFYKTPVGKAIIQDFLIRVPILGNLILSLAIARVARSISVLIRGSGSLLFTLKTLKNTPTGVVKVDKAVEELGAMITHQGCSLEEGLNSLSVFPRAMVSMVSAGVYTGNLPECLDKYAEMLEIQNETTTSDLLTIVEPLLLLILGFLVGFIVMAAFLPVFQLLKTI